MERIRAETMGTIQSVSLDQAKPGRVTVKLVLMREADLVERLARLQDAQLLVGVTLDSLQGELPMGGLGDRVREDVEDALGPDAR